jgi:HEAT repeat protein
MRSIPALRPLLLALVVTAGAVPGLAKPVQPSSADQVKQLVAVLKSDASQKEKADACRELARVGTKEAVAPLAALLPDEKLSHMARYGLETIPDPAVDKALREAAGKLQGRLLVGVIGSIGVRRDAKAASILAKLLHSSDSAVAQAAAKSLGSIGTKAARTALLEALEDVPATNQLAFCEGLLRCAEAAAAKGERTAACDIYDRLREEPGPQQVRVAALRGAILTRGQDGLPLLDRAVVNGDYALFFAAVRAAQEMGGSQVADRLGRELSSLGPDRQVVVIQTLGRIAKKATWPGVFAADKSIATPVRLAAIRALAQIGDLSAVPLLMRLLSSTDKDIAAAAEESIASLPGSMVDAEIKAALEGDTTLSLTAMDLIVRRRMTSAIPALLDYADNGIMPIRISARKKLGELAGPAELPRLLDLLNRVKGPEDLEATEQTISAVCLKAAEPAPCVRQVEARLGQAPPAQKCALVRVLGAVGGTNALPAVRSATVDPNAEVRAVAIRVLGGWATADAAPDLLELAKNAASPADKMICLRGYLRLAGEADLPADKRIAMCREAGALAQKDDEKKLLLGCLGGIPSAEALDLITPYLDDAAVKEEAASAGIDVLEKLLKKKDAKVAAKLAAPLEKVAQTTTNPDVAKRARDLRHAVTK